MFKFLKLRNSDSGDARRHVPFASIIHKPLFLIFALLFSFICIVPVKVSAFADPVPQFNVINGTDLNTFLGGYEAASSDIQWITNALLGAQAIEYAGLGSYKVRFEQLPDDADVWDRIVLIGEKITDDLMSPYVAADRYFSKLIDYAQGALNFAKDFGSRLAFINHVNSLQNFFLEYDSDLGYDLNQFFAFNGGLYNWQSFTDNFSSVFSWNNVTLSQSNQNIYNSVIENFSVPRSFFNSVSSSITNILGNTVPSLNLFIDTDGSSIYLVDDFGNQPSINNFHVILSYNGTLYDPYVTIESIGHNINLDLSNFANAARTILNDSSYYSYLLTFNYRNYRCYCDPNAFLNKVYAGTDWSNKVEVLNNSDLGFSDTDSLQVLNPDPNTQLLFDLKALVEQIVEAQPDPAYELPLKPIIYNITQVNGSPLTAEDLEGISFNVTPPESGIDVPVNVFLSLFDNGKGFISYMWYMTKPLVMYTRSFLDAITFDPVDGFNASGPGYFILGVAGLGLIGGVIVKFLL